MLSNRMNNGDFMSKWIDSTYTPSLAGKNFQKIVVFYLFNCPCEIRTKEKGKTKYRKVSSRGTTFREQGWNNDNVNKLFSAMKKASTAELPILHDFTEEDITFEAEKREKNIPLKDKNFEMVFFKKHNAMNLPSSVFYYIRCALAHGSFSIVDKNGVKTYYLESRKNGKVKARIRLREKTLLEWIDLFNSSSSALKKSGGHKKKKAA